MPVPIRWTSEEGSEANTKFARKFFQNHSRKTSHKDAMSDLFHRLMDISDPFIVGLSEETKKEKKKTLPADMQDLVEHSPSQSNFVEEDLNSSGFLFDDSMEIDQNLQEENLIGKISLTDLPH